MQRIAIFAALQWECAPIVGCVRPVVRRHRDGITIWQAPAPRGEVWVVKTGVGWQRAARAAAVIDDAAFDVFVSTGCAGGLASELTPGNLVVATALIGNHGERFPTDATERRQAEQTATGAGLTTRSGAVLSSPHVLATGSAKQVARAEHDAIAVEMEGGALAIAARRRGVPFVSVRSILDDAAADLPLAGGFAEAPGGARRPLALVRHVVRHPRALSGWWHLRPMIAACRISLQQFFRAWLNESR